MTTTNSSSTSLKAIRINGSVVVESEEDVQRRREERRKKRKSRWNDSEKNENQAEKEKKSLVVFGSSFKRDKKLEPSPMPTMIDASQMNENQTAIYLLKLTIQETTSRLSKPDLGIPPDRKDRSPSPEPIYDSKGVRINKRIDRVRNQLLAQRNEAITKMRALDPTYQPPSNYKYKDATLEDKVFIPADEYPNINFIGLLLGPRGHFLEEMKKETNCNIIIRGKGSLKSGMTGISKEGKKFEALEEPLHAFITGNKAEDVKKAADKIRKLVEMQIYNPDSEQAVALRSKHMHELAMLNGTLKDIDMKCLTCGRIGHKTWQCSEATIFTSSVICSACGGVGHLTKDCKQSRPGSSWIKGNTDKETIDKEYDAFLTDMGLNAEDKRKAMEEHKPSSFSTADISKCLNSSNAPLMLTNGRSGPGAASAYVRGQQLQTPVGILESVGTSIFGGKQTRLTAGYKSPREIEMENEKKKQEDMNRPVPIEWQVERYEKQVNKQYEIYLKDLESYCQREKDKGQLQQPPSSHPPPPPPLPAIFGKSKSVLDDDNDDDLPKLLG